jgi:hypothetical protein
MFSVKHKIRRALVGAVAVAALALAASAGAGPSAHADGPVIYGPGDVCCFSLSGIWYDSGGYGTAGNEVYTYSNGNESATSVATWRARGLQPNALYDLCAYIPDWDADAHAHYTTSTIYGAFDVDQSRFSNQWAWVGSSYADSSGALSVSVSDRSADYPGSAVIGADAMLIIPVALNTIIPLNDGQYPTQYQCSPTGLGNG